MDIAAALGRLAGAQPAPAERELTAFVAVINNAAGFAEHMSAPELFRFMAGFKGCLEEAIRANGGVVESLAGDSVCALWNAPLDYKDHQAAACLAALDCQEAVEEFRKKAGVPGLSVRIGLDSGTAVAGLLVCGGKSHYTAVGEVVNRAAGLAGANRFFETGTLAGAAAYGAAKDAVIGRGLGRLRFPGIRVPAQAFELLARKGGLPEEWEQALPAFEKGVERYAAREFAAAAAAFRQVLESVPDDSPSGLYARAADDYAVIPPPEEWEPVFNLPQG